MRPLSALCSILTISGLTLGLAQPGFTQTVLTQAVVESVSNQVRVVPKSQSPRSAKVSDVIRPGDAIATAASSRADLRFNDRSLARLGAQSIFRFNPGTRNIDLVQGTALVLIRPGQGGTTVRTPNGAAGVRGSAMVVRYDPESTTMMVIALTNSGIVVFNETASEAIPIAAGEMAVLAQGQAPKIYKVDLDTFYATSPLVQGLELNTLEATGTDTEDGLEEVRAETTEGLESQTPVDAEASDTIVNPEFVQMTATEEPDLTAVETTVADVDINTIDPDGDLVGAVADSQGDLDVWSVVEGGEVRREQAVMDAMRTGGVVPSSTTSGSTTSGSTTTVTIITLPGVGSSTTTTTCRAFPGGGATGGVKPGQGAGNFCP